MGVEEGSGFDCVPGRVDFNRFNFNFRRWRIDTLESYGGLRGPEREGEFMWSGLSPHNAIHPFPAPFGNVNLYTITANHRYQADRINESPFGVYLIGGGGWYYRFASIDRDFVVPALVPCIPVYTWWGFDCTASGFVVTQRIATTLIPVTFGFRFN